MNPCLIFGQTSACLPFVAGTEPHLHVCCAVTGAPRRRPAEIRNSSSDKVRPSGREGRTSSQAPEPDNDVQPRKDVQPSRDNKQVSFRRYNCSKCLRIVVRR